ncbi:MAG TPA: hypothetical protein VEJ39_04560 [Candidatus Acidoferrales bacterium]|nr:hypothetical protein [Candidatus Acidoferrales bacterium]
MNRSHSPQAVTDIRSNPNDQIAHAVRLLQRSKHRRLVFAAIYRGKKQFKMARAIAKEVGLEEIRVLQEGKVLTSNQIAIPLKVEGLTAFQKDTFFSNHKDRILRMAQNPSSLKTFPTKTNPTNHRGAQRTIRLARNQVRVRRLTIEDVDSFRKVRRFHSAEIAHRPVREKWFKEGIQRILGEPGKFQDWGGERSDLYSTRLRFAGRRVHAAFGFKGKGQRGILTLRRMGKNGDQVYRLFQEPAQAFFVQYWGQIQSAILLLMEQLAIARSATTGETIYFGQIDGRDTQALIAAYRSKFR